MTRRDVVDMMRSGRGTEPEARVKGHRQMKRVSFVLALAAGSISVAGLALTPAPKPAAKPATGRLAGHGA